ncbi:MAG: cysteine hydrolase, partial [Candidatus Rokubacteria bacterium]|nr:cysteine hydrolase [Candidatus Rokubacteria bacterium]
MALTIDPRRTAILPLDLQNDNIAGTAGLKEKQTLEKIARLLEAGRRKKLPIIHITASVRADYLDMPKSNELWRALRSSKKLIIGTPGAEIHPMVAPKADELVINKTCVDPFLSTNLGQALINFDVNTLIVCGLWTNYVVEATTRHAADVGYHVIVVSDCCASNNEENHRFAMERILPT